MLRFSMREVPGDEPWRYEILWNERGYEDPIAIVNLVGDARMIVDALNATPTTPVLDDAEWQGWSKEEW